MERFGPVAAGLELGPEVTLSQLIELWPSTPYTLFARFGVGSRDKLGFRPEQKLGEVLRRYLIFDVDKVLNTIWETEQHYATLYHDDPPGDWSWVDVRGQEEHAIGGLTHWRYLDRDLAGELLGGPKDRPVVFFCRTGPLAAAAASHFRSRGLVAAWALTGGLERWTSQKLPAYPCYGNFGGASPLSPGRLHLMPYRQRAVWKCEAISPGLRRIYEPREWEFGPARLWQQADRLVIERSTAENWYPFSSALIDFLEARRYLQAPYGDVPLVDLNQQIPAFLQEVVQPTLVTHKGTIELVGLKDGWASLNLGGGCQGCSSAAITVNDEIARMLLERFEELLGVVDVSVHDGDDLSPPY